MADPVRNVKESAEHAAEKSSTAVKNRLVSVTSTAGTAASIGLTAVRERKTLAAGAGGGLLALLTGAFALGRGTARRKRGPLTRLTGGRI